MGSYGDEHHKYLMLVSTLITPAAPRIRSRYGEPVLQGRERGMPQRGLGHHRPARASQASAQVRGAGWWLVVRLGGCPRLDHFHLPNWFSGKLQLLLAKKHICSWLKVKTRSFTLEKMSKPQVWWKNPHNLGPSHHLCWWTTHVARLRHVLGERQVKGSDDPALDGEVPWRKSWFGIDWWMLMDVHGIRMIYIYIQTRVSCQHYILYSILSTLVKNNDIMNHCGSYQQH